MSKWSFQWITNFVNYTINIQSYQNTNKITFHSNSLVCVFFHCFWMLQVRENESSLRNSSGGSEYLHTQRKHCWRCNANGRSQIALYFLHYKGNPHVTVTITKNASLAAIARYISITTIYTVGYLQIFNTGHFFSSKHCNDLQI